MQKGKKINYNISTMVNSRPNHHALKIQCQMTDHPQQHINQQFQSPKSKLIKKAIDKNKIKVPKNQKNLNGKNLKVSVKITHVTKSNPKLNNELSQQKRPQRTFRPQSPKSKSKILKGKLKMNKSSQSLIAKEIPERSILPAQIKKAEINVFPKQKIYIFTAQGFRACSQQNINYVSRYVQNFKDQVFQQQQFLQQRQLQSIERNVTKIQRCWRNKKFAQKINKRIQKKNIEKNDKLHETKKNEQPLKQIQSLQQNESLVNNSSQIQVNINSKLDQLKKAVQGIDQKTDLVVSGEWIQVIKTIQQLAKIQDSQTKCKMVDKVLQICKKKKKDYGLNGSLDISQEEELQLQNYGPKGEQTQNQAIINIRQNALQVRFTAIMKIFNNLLQNGDLTPQEFKVRTQKVRKWIQKQKNQVQEIKQLLATNFLKAQNMLHKTRKDIQLAQKVKEKKLSIDQLMKQFQNQVNVGKSTPEDKYLKILCQGSYQSSQEYQKHNQLILAMFQRELKLQKQIQEAIQKRIFEQRTRPRNFSGGPNSFCTSLYYINVYLSNLSNFIYSFHKQTFLKNINVHYGYTPEQRLQIIHAYYDQMPENPNDDGLRNTIQLCVFQELNQKLYEDQSNQLEVVHNRALFDAFNIALRHFRPYYSINGSPYSWTIGDRALTFFCIEQQNLQEVFQKSKLKVMEWAAKLLGLHYPQKSPQSPKIMKANHYSELLRLYSTGNKIYDQKQKIKHKESQKQQIQEQQIQWHQFQEERTGFMIQLSEYVFLELVEELNDQLVIGKFMFL